MPPPLALPSDGRLALRVTSRRLDLWGTVLSARGLPFRSASLKSPERGHDGGFALFTPPLLEKLARAELAAFAAEKKTPPPLPSPVRHNAHWVLAGLLFLILWHGLRMGWWGGLSGLSPETWVESGAADAFRILRRHEWYRTVTALTLHADSQHLFANVLFGAPFLILLCRKTGLGAGFLLTLLSGTLGNVCNTLYRPIGHSSIGFSTALFGAVGALSGLLATEGLRQKDRLRWRRGVVLLAAGSGVLALLGSEGARTDYGAHLFGLLAGFFTGGVFGLLTPLSRIQENLAGIAAALLLALCWSFAL